MTALLALGILGQVASIDRWQPFEKGFERDSDGTIHVHPTATSEPTGATFTVTLNQSQPRPVVFSAESRCADVSLPTDDGYSIYIDTKYTDGTYLYATTTDFQAGSHEWQKRQAIVWPTKPIQSVSIYLLLRGHTGDAWFRNPSFKELAPGHGFDGQAMPAPRLPAGTSAGWFLRKFDPTPSDPVYLEGGRTLRLTGESGRATIYYCVRCDLDRPRWWPTIRRSEPVAGYESATYHSVNAGPIGQMSLYPYACVTNGSKGTMVAVPPSQGPCVFRLFYDSDSRLLCAAFDVYLDRKGETFRVFQSDCDPAWGLRDAAARYARAFPEVAAKRVKKEGIWIPFTDPSKVPHVDDFGIAFHEGDNSVASDAKLGIDSFRYSEPMSWWMAMAPALPRTYGEALSLAKSSLDSSAEETKIQAQALFDSGTSDVNGNYNVTFENQPWTNGAVWLLNPNPALMAHPSIPGGATKASIVYGTGVDRRLGSGSLLSGEYLDSLEGWADVRDYSPRSLAASHFPATFSLDSEKPFIPEWFSTYEITKYMSDDLHRRGKLLMANTIAWSKSCLVPLLDLGGTETNWQNDGRFEPEGDDMMCYRRTLSYAKPYLLLMNTDFSTWKPEMTKKYFQRCLAYGIFPSFFSADAATKVYWENPSLYERDRPLFKKYMPVFQMLGHAGWQPVTLARASDDRLWVERFGDGLWTVFNPTASAIRFRLTTPRAGHGFVDVMSRDRLGVGEETMIQSEECRVFRAVGSTG